MRFIVAILLLLGYIQTGLARDPYKYTYDALMAYPQIKFHRKRMEEYLWRQIWIDRNDLATIGATARLLTSKELDTNILKIRKTYKDGYFTPRVIYNFETKETNIRIYWEYRF